MIHVLYVQSHMYSHCAASPQQQRNRQAVTLPRPPKRTHRVIIKVGLMVANLRLEQPVKWAGSDCTYCTSTFNVALVPRLGRPRGGGRQPCRGVCPPASIPLLLYRTVTIKVGLTLYRGLDQRGSMFTEIIQGRRTQQCRLGTGQPSLPHGLYIAAPIMCSPQ